jgi:hypothetical protein
MAVIFVARSPSFSKWASDVGFSKHVFKVGVTEEPVKAVVQAGWAGESDWTVVKKEDAQDLTENEVLERLARKEKLIDPEYYPRLKGARGIFRVSATNVQNHILVSKALAGEDIGEVKLKPADFAAYLIRNAIG